MKLSEFRESIKERILLVKANFVFTAQKELAYAGNNWINLLSTSFYTLAILIFVNVMYSNVQTIAGYSKNEMLFFFLVSQLTYYSNWLITMRNLGDLIPDVNNGNLDMILIKPVPSLFYLMTRTISFISILRDALVPTLAIVISINWQLLNLTLERIFLALLVWVFGLIILNAFQIIAALPVFWFGESQNILDLASSLSAAEGTLIPFEGYDKNLRVLLSTLLPVLIASGFTTSLLLGKSNPLILFFWSLAIVILSLFTLNAAWKHALKHYSSASS